MKYYFAAVLLLLFLTGAYAENDSLKVSPDTTRVKEYVDKISVSISFIHIIVPPDNYTPGGFNLTVNYKVWRNFSIGLYTGCTFSRDLSNRSGFYTSWDTYLNTMGSLGYRYYIYKNKLSFGLYGMAGMYYRRINSHIQDKKNNIDRTYHASHADACMGALFNMQFAINKYMAINVSASIFSNPYWYFDNYAGVGLVYNYGSKRYNSIKKIIHRSKFP